MKRVRTTRAYLAGFGTAGSLLAAAAVLFIVASAVVSFRGFPEISRQTRETAKLNRARFARTPLTRRGRHPSRRVLLAFAGARDPRGAATSGRTPRQLRQPRHAAIPGRRPRRP